MNQVIIAIRFTLVTTLFLGLIYPGVVTGLAQLFFREKANGQLIYRDGKLIGSLIIGQPFSGPGYFHSRPSAAGNGYDAGASSGSNLAPTNKKLMERVNAATAGQANVPVDMVTTSGSGLDPHITPAAALFQADRVARERRIARTQIVRLIEKHSEQRQFGLLGEKRVNVLLLNLELDELR